MTIMNDFTRKEYIEREAAKKIMIAFYGAYDTDGNHERKLALLEIDLALRAIPAADVAPVRHGRWVLTTQPLGWRDEDCAECSECGEDFVLDEWGIADVKDAMRYCPNCGAKMDKDGDGE